MAGDLAFASIAELARLLRSRRTSATELAELFLERLERFGPRYNCLVTVTPERALAEAARADRELATGKIRGPLHGIPYGVKDLLAVRGYPTTWGAEPYRAQTFEEDATVVTRLGAAGAVLVGKLAMVELAGGMGYSQANASFTGPGKTPWNTDYWSGGSSSGPGAAVAAGLVPFAIGSETSGSILTPAAYCGISGLRPTYGLVSRHGAMALSWTMDKLGPMARSAEDCALVLAAMAGRDPLDASSVARGFRAPPPEPRGHRRFRIGVPGGTIIAAEGLSAFDDLLDGNRLKDLTAPEDRTGGYGALAISARDYLRALRVRRLMGRAYDELLKPFDAIATPTRTTVASPIDRPFRDAYPDVRGGVSLIGSSNVVGVPAISVPNGFGLAGLPTGLSLVARAFDEARLVRIARAYQARTDWHTRRPEVA